MGLCEVRKSGLTIVIIPARSDNYMYLLEWDGGTALIDATDAEIATQVCRDRERRLDAILTTHHHFDHVGGNQALQTLFACPIHGPAKDIPGLTHPVQAGSHFKLGPLAFSVIGTPGHTAGCLSYHLAQQAVVFTGDALFAGGCGRLSECDPITMFESLNRLASLPPFTELYCGHEYTESNLRFALSVEPTNRALQARACEVRNARGEGQPTVPSTIATELATNPFMRATNAAEFANRRRAKDRF